MLALTLRQTGLQRMGAGVATLGRALLDMGRGIYAMLTGLGLFIAGIVLTPWIWISLLFVRRAPATAEARRWKRFIKACRRLGQTVLEWAAFAFVATMVIVGLVLGFSNLDASSRVALTSTTNIIYPIAFFLALAVLYLVGWLVVRLGAALLGHLNRRLTRQGLLALALVAIALLAGATGAILYAAVKPTLVVALIAGVAVLAGLAGFALISFGPSGVALFHLGRGAHARSGRRGQLQKQTSSLKARPSQPVLVVRQQVVSVSPQAGPPLAMAAVSGTLAADLVDVRESKGHASGKRWSLPWISVDRTGLLIAIASILALLLAWGGGERLLRAAPETSESVVPAVGPAGSPAAPRANAKPGTGAAEIIRLSADGEAADVAWQAGHRRLTARSDNGRVVQQLTLPPAACRAAAIVVFGAASSDGSAARNDRLAERRARWLREWTQAELGRCPAPAPAVIAVTLGQARGGAPSPAQRSVRLLAIREEDLRDPAFLNTPSMLRDMARGAFKDLDAFPRFDACVLSARGGAGASDTWLPACAPQPQGDNLAPSREPT